MSDAVEGYRRTSCDLWIPCLVVMTLLLGSPSAAAQSRCEEANVRVEGQPEQRWAAVLESLCQVLASMPDRDTSAAVRLLASDGDVIVEVVLSDGRSAIRRVTQPSALRAALEALLVLPPERVAPPTAAPPQEPAVSSTPVTPAPATPPAQAEPPSTAELALSAGARVAGAGFGSLGPAAEAYLPTGHWRFGLWARWDTFQSVRAPSRLDHELDTLGAGVAVARRLAFRAVDVDVGFAPRLIVETQSFELASADGEDQDETRTTTDVRVATFGRLLFGHTPLRFFAGVDAELSPVRLRRQVRAHPLLPALPAWSAGISAGVSWTAP